MFVNREFDSNEIDERDLHDAKHSDLRISILHGITIDFSDERRKARFPICVNRKVGSKEITEYCLQLWKDKSGTSRTEPGTHAQRVRSGSAFEKDGAVMEPCYTTTWRW
jgi:hypothetical protein